MRSFEGLSINELGGSSRLCHYNYFISYCTRNAKDVAEALSVLDLEYRQELNKLLGEMFMSRTLGEVDLEICPRVAREIRHQLRRGK